MERVFCVNRTEVNKSYSRSRAWKSPKSRTSERSVSTRRSLVSLVRSLARSRFTLACIASHVYASRELIGSSKSVDFHLFFALFPFFARRYYSAQPVKEKKSEATDQSLSINPDTCRSYAASTQTGAIASNGNVILQVARRSTLYTLVKMQLADKCNNTITY